MRSALEHPRGTIFLWLQVTTGMPRINVGAVDLSDRAAAWLKVAANVNNESMRVHIAKALDGHIKRFKASYAADVKFLARQWNVTWEEMFILLNQHEPPYSPDEIEWAKQQPPLVIWEEEQIQFGIELQQKSLSEQETESSDDHP